MGPVKSDVIKKFLNAKTHPDLAVLYSKAMEVQVNSAQDKGRRIDMGGVHAEAKTGFGYTDGMQTWTPFRIPAKAMTNPEDNDGPLKWSLDEHCEGIGLTGWDWMERKSRWVAYDFDAMMGHSEQHTKKLSDAQLDEVRQVVMGLPYVTLRKSTSGKGLHLYVFLEPVSTDTHTEHAALARSILSYLSGLTGFPFTDRVDIAGGNMWIWHRKMYDLDNETKMYTQNDGLKLIKQGEVFPASRIPANWREHLSVTSRKTNRIVPCIDGATQTQFEELSGQRAKVRIDDQHKKLINWLAEHNYPGWWDADNHMLVTHTHYLGLAHKHLMMRGEFHTLSTGTNAGHDINCFMFPTKDGSWAIRRYGIGTKEHEYWVQDGKGWTRCYLNRELSLDDVARLHNAIELESGGYQFKNCVDGKSALRKLGINVVTSQWCDNRVMKVKEQRQEYKLVVLIPQVNGDNQSDMDGWLSDKNLYRRIFNNPRAGLPDEQVALADYDDTVRHIISENGEDLGWVVNTDDGTWRHEPVNHVKLLMTSRGIGKKDIEIILGQAISQAWVIVNRPFEPEYPGDRQWNRSSARFKIAPTLDGESLSFPTWDRIFNHCGKSLNDAIGAHAWCKANGITSGGAYLKLWFASLVKHPQQPLPYLAFFGPQDSGKSTIHEAFCQLILDGGYMDGALALLSGGNFNGELQDSILCTLEEVDLRKGPIYQKIKDWVTSAQISIHIKGQTPYKCPNFTHWIQCVNDRDYIPAFAGDTRVTMAYVETLAECDKIPKRDLWTRLQKEASDFLAYLLSVEIPDSRDRLMLPIIRTAEKVSAEFNSMNPVEQFFEQKTFPIQGALTSFDEALKAFHEWVGIEEMLNWSKHKFSKAIPQNIPRGRVNGIGNQWQYLGNISMKEGVPPDKRWVGTGLFIKQDASVK